MVLADVSAETGVTVEDLKSPCRLPLVVDARRVAARRLRDGGLSYPAIGRALGGRHHTSAMYLCATKGASDARRDSAERVRREVAAGQRCSRCHLLLPCDHTGMGGAASPLGQGR